MKISKIFFFQKDIEELEFSKATSVARIIFGLILFHRFIDLYFSSPLSFNDDFKNLIGIFLSFSTIIGFFTPFSLPLLSLFNWITANNLSSQIISITSIVLFMSHSWKYNSFDSLLRKKSIFISFLFNQIEYIYVRTHILRTFAIWLWGGICFSAMAFHFTDKSWISGTAVLTLLRTPYLNDYYNFFNNINDNIFLILSKISLWGMAVWELFLWIVPGVSLIRKITFWWGIVFFFSSILFINLSYLPYLEIIFWLIIYRPEVFLLKKFLKNTNSPLYKKEKYYKPNYFIELTLVISGLISIIYMNIGTNINIHGGSKRIKDIGSKMLSYRIPITFASGIFGQNPVNVFNQDDLKMNRYSILICRNLESGKKELVPFQDSNGGRLSYLANDNFYFTKSLGFQRGTRKLDKNEVYDRWFDLSKEIISYDFLLNAQSQILNYKALLLEHNPNYIKQNILAGWNKNSKANVVFSEILKTSDINTTKKLRILIPPGHFNEKIRIKTSERDFC